MEKQKKIQLPKKMGKTERNRLIEFALLKGFQSVSAEFPVVSTTEGEEVPESFSQYELQLRKLSCHYRCDELFLSYNQSCEKGN
ncbi:hypothetical protein JCM37172_01310 [Faecalimonas hominis]